MGAGISLAQAERAAWRAGRGSMPSGEACGRGRERLWVGPGIGRGTAAGSVGRGHAGQRQGCRRSAEHGSLRPAPVAAARGRRGSGGRFRRCAGGCRRRERGDGGERAPVEQDERSGGPDVEGEVGVTQASGQQSPPIGLGDDVGGIAAVAGRNPPVRAEVPRDGPGDEAAHQVAVVAALVEPGVEVGLGGGAEVLAVLVEPGQQLQGEQGLRAGPGGGAAGGGAPACALTGAAKDVPGREQAHDAAVLGRCLGEDRVEPDVVAVQQLGPAGQDRGTDQQIA